ncbi:MAG TPA: hypothetical protein VN969_41700 [Streptosporangiaceae bacterium]|jgi:hypothetical protein|nr:hypothetical protein [Streptosporangiaceae bacterium]
MLTFATDFWPMFWTAVGSGAAVAVLCSWMLAAFSSQPQPIPAEYADTLTELAAARRAHDMRRAA